MSRDPREDISVKEYDEVMCSFLLGDDDDDFWYEEDASPAEIEAAFIDFIQDFYSYGDWEQLDDFA